MARPRGGADAGRGEVSLSRVLSYVERQMSRLVEATLATSGLSVDQWRVLDLLADGAGHPMSEIAGLVVVPGPTLTKIMDRLVDEALVYRLVDERDRRRVLAFLSSTGRDLHERLRPQVQGLEQAVLATLGDDAAQLLALLARLGSSPLRLPPVPSVPSVPSGEPGDTPVMPLR